MESLYKNPKEMTFDEVLAELKLTESDYIDAIRSSVKSPKIFLKRGSLDVGINVYNPDILSLWEANIDVQYITDELAVAVYMVNYISKSEAGLSKLLRQAVADTRAGNLSLRESFRKISNVFPNGTLLSAQEAVYLDLSMPLSKFSREVVFINTGPIDSRVHMMKSKADLKKMDVGDTNVTVPDIFEKYATRDDLDEIFLADFVATKTERKLPSGKIEYKTREKSRINRYVRYAMDEDKVIFFREQCLLFFPWRHEKQDIELKNCADLYYQNQELIKENQCKYVTISYE